VLGRRMTKETTRTLGSKIGRKMLWRMSRRMRKDSLEDRFFWGRGLEEYLSAARSLLFSCSHPSTFSHSETILKVLR